MVWVFLHTIGQCRTLGFYWITIMLMCDWFSPSSSDPCVSNSFITQRCHCENTHVLWMWADILENLPHMACVGVRYSWVQPCLLSWCSVRGIPNCVVTSFTILSYLNTMVFVSVPYPLPKIFLYEPGFLTLLNYWKFAVKLLFVFNTDVFVNFENGLQNWHCREKL